MFLISNLSGMDETTFKEVALGLCKIVLFVAWRTFLVPVQCTTMPFFRTSLICARKGSLSFMFVPNPVFNKRQFVKAHSGIESYHHRDYVNSEYGFLRI